MVVRMATVHLIHGFLGSGKTTFARQLEESLPAIRFTHDEWMSRIYGEDPPVERFAEYFRDPAGSLRAARFRRRARGGSRGFGLSQHVRGIVSQFESSRPLKLSASFDPLRKEWKPAPDQVIFDVSRRMGITLLCQMI